MHRLTQYIVIFIIAVLLVGCTSNKPNEVDYSNQSIIVYTSSPNEQSFYQSYGNNILKYFPGIDIQLILNEEGTEFDSTTLDKLQPDLLFLYYSDYRRLQKEGYLSPLNINDKYSSLDESQYAEIMLDMLSDHSGTLHGLSPNVYMSVLFFNKKLFDNYNVEYLTNGMSWEEVLSVAHSFSDHVGVEAAGITPASLLLNYIAATDNLTLIDEDYNVLMEGEEWKRAVDQVVSLYQHSKVSNRGGEFFKQGESAIYHSSISSFKELIGDEFEWGFVSMPTHPTYRDNNNSIVLDQVISLPRTASNRELSYHIIEKLMSEEVSETYSTGLKSHTISTLKSKMNDYDGLDITTLWEQEVYPLSYLMPLDIEQGMIEQVYPIVDNHLKLAIEGELSVEDCMERINSQLILILSSKDK